MNRPVATASAATLLLLLGLALFWPKPDRGTKIPGNPAPANPRKPITALGQTGALSALPRRSAKFEPAEPPQREFDPYEDWDTKKILDNFMVPPGGFPSMTLAGAVTVFHERYQEHGGRNITFHFDGDAADPGFLLDFEYGNISLGHLMELSAALAGFEMEIGEGTVTFTPIPPSPDDDTLATLRFEVPPTIVTDLYQRQAVDDPFDPNPPPQLNAEEGLANWGIDVASAGGVVVYDPKTSTLSVELTLPELGRAEAVVNHLSSGRSTTQILLSQKIITTESDLPFDPQTFATDAEFQVAMRAMAQQKGVDLISAPAVVTRPGQRAMVEIGRQVIYQTDPADGGPGHLETRMVGTQLPITPVLTGIDRVQLEGAAEFTALGNQTLRSTIGSSLGGKPEPLASDPGGFRTHATDFSGELYDGNTATIHAAEEDGTLVYQFITARRINPDGTPLLPAP